MFSVIEFRRAAGMMNSRNARQVQRDRGPGERHESAVLADPLKPVARVEQVLGVRVVLLEGLGAVQEQIQEHRVGHQLGDLPDRLRPGSRTA